MAYKVLPSPTTIGGKLNFTVPGSAAGTVFVRRIAAAAAIAGAIASALVPAYTSGSGSTTTPPITSPSDYTLTAAGTDLNYNGNGVDEVQSDGTRRFLPFSEWELETDSPTVVFTQLSTGSSLTASYFANGTFVKAFRGNGTVTITSPVAAGVKWRVMTRGGSQDRDNEIGDIKFTRAASATLKGGSSTSVVKVTRAEYVYFSSANSIDNGAVCESWRGSAPTLDVTRERSAYTMLLRTASRAVVVDGYGSHQAWVACATEAGRQAIVARYGAGRVSGTNRFVGPEMTNAFYFAAVGQTAAAYAEMVGKLLDLVHSTYPGDLIYQPTAIVRLDYTGGNNNNEKLEDFRSAATGLGTTRSWLKVVDGLTMVSKSKVDKTTSKGDDLHPDEDGHAEDAANWELIFAGATKGNASQGASTGGTTTPGGGGTTTPGGGGTTTPTTHGFQTSQQAPNSADITVTNGVPARTAGESAWNAAVYWDQRIEAPATGVTSVLAVITSQPRIEVDKAYTHGYGSRPARLSRTEADVRKDIVGVGTYLGGDGGYGTWCRGFGQYDYLDPTLPCLATLRGDGSGGGIVRYTQPGYSNPTYPNDPELIREEPVPASKFPLEPMVVLNNRPDAGAGQSGSKLQGFTVTGPGLVAF